MTIYHFCTILFTQIHKPKSHDLLTLVYHYYDHMTWLDNNKLHYLNFLHNDDIIYTVIIVLQCIPNALLFENGCP